MAAVLCAVSQRPTPQSFLPVNPFPPSGGCPVCAHSLALSTLEQLAHAEHSHRVSYTHITVWGFIGDMTDHNKIQKKYMID